MLNSSRLKGLTASLTIHKGHYVSSKYAQRNFIYLIYIVKWMCKNVLSVAGLHCTANINGAEPSTPNTG